MNAQEMLERYNVTITDERLEAFREERRRAKGPPFRFGFEYAETPELTDEERERAEDNLREWELGIADLDPDAAYYTILRATNFAAAREQAEELWRRRSPSDAVIGYSIWSADWSCAYTFLMDDPDGDAELEGDDVRPR
jgi:hypothetical protein